MKTFPGLAVSIFISFHSPLTDSVKAQSGESPSPLPSVAKQKAEPVRFDLDVRNAKLSEIVAFLRSKDPKANIVVAAGAEGFVVRELQLKNVSAIEAGDYIIMALNGLVHCEQIFDNGMVFIASSSASPVRMRAFDLTEYLAKAGGDENVAIEQLRSTIERALKLFDSARVPNLEVADTPGVPVIEYHAGTKLLLVAGNEIALEMISEMVSAVSKQNNPGKSTQPTAK